MRSFMRGMLGKSRRVASEPGTDSALSLFGVALKYYKFCCCCSIGDQILHTALVHCYFLMLVFSPFVSLPLILF